MFIEASIADTLNPLESISTDDVNFSTSLVPYTFDIFFYIGENFYLYKIHMNVLPGLNQKTKKDLKKMFFDHNKA